MMRLGMTLLLAVITLAVLSCTSEEPPSDRELISKITNDIETAVQDHDMMKIDKHLSAMAKQEGFDANRFLMLSSYGEDYVPELTGWTVRVMDDSARVFFTLIEAGSLISDSTVQSVIRLKKEKDWQIMSYDIKKNLATP